MRLLLTYILVLVCSLPAGAQDRIELRDLDVSAYPAISLSLQVRDADAVLYPPDPARIVIHENGIPLSFDLSCPELTPQRPTIAIGFERSLDANFPPAVLTARDFIAHIGFIDHDAEASLWSFATTVDHEVDITRDSAALQQALSGLSAAQWPFNGTALYECMHNSIEDAVGAGSGSTRAVVFVTDGYNNSSWFGRTLDQVRGRAAIDKVRIYVLLLRNRDDGAAAMRTLTEATGGFMVEHDVPGAVDSIYADIERPDITALWCTLRATGRGCADGGTRRLDVGYARGEGDTLWQRYDIVVPYRPDDLQPLHVWFSPAETWPDDTLVTVACGVELRDGLQPPPFTLAIPLTEMQLRAAETLNWNSSWDVRSDTLFLRTVPPSSGLIDGLYVLARFEFFLTEANVRPFLASLAFSGNGCLRYAESVYPAAAVLALDTALIERGGKAALRMRIPGKDFPEGLQRIDVTLAVAAEKAAFVPPFDQQHLGMPRGWWVVRADMRTVQDEQQLRLVLRGYADSAYSPVSLPLQVSGDAPYRVPVRITAPVKINGSEGVETASGLLVVRDSCYNNVVVQSGVVVSSPWPQPAAKQISLRVLSPGRHLLSVRVLDALGRERLLREMEIPAGASTITCDVAGLPAGTYTLQCSDAETSAYFPLVVLP